MDRVVARISTSAHGRTVEVLGPAASTHLCGKDQVKGRSFSAVHRRQVDGLTVCTRATREEWHEALAAARTGLA